MRLEIRYVLRGGCRDGAEGVLPEPAKRIAVPVGEWMPFGQELYVCTDAYDEQGRLVYKVDE